MKKNMMYTFVLAVFCLFGEISGAREIFALIYNSKTGVVTPVNCTFDVNDQQGYWSCKKEGKACYFESMIRAMIKAGYQTLLSRHQNGTIYSITITEQNLNDDGNFITVKTVISSKPIFNEDAKPITFDDPMINVNHIYLSGKTGDVNYQYDILDISRFNNQVGRLYHAHLLLAVDTSMNLGKSYNTFDLDKATTGTIELLSDKDLTVWCETKIPINDDRTIHLMDMYDMAKQTSEIIKKS